MAHSTHIGSPRTVTHTRLLKALLAHDARSISRAIEEAERVGVDPSGLAAARRALGALGGPDGVGSEQHRAEARRCLQVALQEEDASAIIDAAKQAIFCGLEDAKLFTSAEKSLKSLHERKSEILDRLVAAVESVAGELENDVVSRCSPKSFQILEQAIREARVVVIPGVDDDLVSHAERLIVYDRARIATVESLQGALQKHVQNMEEIARGQAKHTPRGTPRRTMLDGHAGHVGSMCAPTAGGKIVRPTDGPSEHASAGRHVALHGAAGVCDGTRVGGERTHPNAVTFGAADDVIDAGSNHSLGIKEHPRAGMHAVLHGAAGGRDGTRVGGERTYTDEDMLAAAEVGETGFYHSLGTAGHPLTVVHAALHGSAGARDGTCFGGERVHSGAEMLGMAADMSDAGSYDSQGIWVEPFGSRRGSKGHPNVGSHVTVQRAAGAYVGPDNGGARSQAHADMPGNASTADAAQYHRNPDMRHAPVESARCPSFRAGSSGVLSASALSQAGQRDSIAGGMSDGGKPARRQSNASQVVAHVRGFGVAAAEPVAPGRAEASREHIDPAYGNATPAPAATSFF